MTPMKTTTIAMLGLMIALALAGPAAAEDLASDSSSARACEPVWVDNDGEVHFNADCVGPAPADRARSP